MTPAERGTDALEPLYRELCAKKAAGLDDKLGAMMRARLIGHLQGRKIA